MKVSILATAAILILAAMPAQAQRRGEPITCYRTRNVISCPNYGEFQFRNSNNGRFNNNGRNDDDDRVFGDRRSNRYNDNTGLQAINEIYIQVLGRRTDLGGARTYIQYLNNGWTLERVRNDIAYSPEATQVINRAYQDILRRDADPNGLETYKRYLASGRSITDLRRELSRSTEARNR